MKFKIKLALAAWVLATGGITSAQTLLNASYDVAREFYKDYNAAFVAHYKKPPARTSRSISRTVAPARRRAPSTTVWTPMW